MAETPVLLITGASSGIGAEAARHAARAGWRVALGARSEEKLDDLVAELGDDAALGKRCDVTDWGDQEALVGAALERFGRLDAVLANAGVGAKRGFLEESVEHWRAMVDTNVLGVALTIRAALGHFREQGRGHFLLTGSLAGRRALPGSLYSATKWAVTAMGEGLRQEVSGSGIRVTLVEPGMVDTPFFDSPVDQALRAEDVARAIVYALSEPAHVDVNEILIRPVSQGS
ncbi:MAG TPA: SDR family oxidoreductase [Thermoleophilaceae bacterium]|nr:SDR family oxidoreductase [Thermoleophilaceae bacterium]